MLLTVVALLVADAPRWPAFLGQGATPVEPSTIPLEWSAKKNRAWRVALPDGMLGQSSPVIWGDAVFVTGIAGKEKETCHVAAFALADGKLRWSKEEEAAQKVRSNYFQSRSAPTPVVDAQRVYAFFETGNVVAYAHDGTPAWTRNLVEDYGELVSTIGLAASPTQTDDAVIVLIDHEGPSYLLALDKATGATKWKAERTPRHSYASPVLVELAGRQQLVVSSDGSVDGYDPATGKLLWTYGKVGANSLTSPTLLGGNRLLLGASPGMHNEKEELARESNLCLELSGAGAALAPKVAWKQSKAYPSFGSPMAYRGLAYWVTKAGILYCFDAATGEQKYAQRLRQQCWATPVGLGERVYFFGKDGMTTVIAAEPKYRLLAENDLFDADVPRDRLGAAGKDGDHAGHGKGKPAEKSGPPAGVAKGKGGKAGERPSAGPGGAMFADPIQYGVAMVDGSLVIRTGAALHCLRTKAAGSAAR